MFLECAQLELLLINEGFMGGFVRESLTCSENLAASIATGRELGIVAVAAVDFVRLGAELLVHQGHSALAAQEARLVPVLVFVGKVLKRNTKSTLSKTLSKQFKKWIEISFLLVARDILVRKIKITLLEILTKRYMVSLPKTTF
jgi:hypothetical protein